jgi:hypothetical protein
MVINNISDEAAIAQARDIATGLCKNYPLPTRQGRGVTPAPWMLAHPSKGSALTVLRSYPSCIEPVLCQRWRGAGTLHPRVLPDASMGALPPNRRLRVPPPITINRSFAVDGRAGFLCLVYGQAKTDG